MAKGNLLFWTKKSREVWECYSLQGLLLGSVRYYLDEWEAFVGSGESVKLIASDRLFYQARRAVEAEVTEKANAGRAS